MAMVRQSPTQPPLRVPPVVPPASEHARGRPSRTSLRVVGAAAATHSAAHGDAGQHRKRAPTLPTTPRRAGARNAALQRKAASSTDSAEHEGIRDERGHGMHETGGDARGSGSGDRIQRVPDTLHGHRGAASAVVSLPLPRVSASSTASANALTDEDVLLLCGVQPGSSKALWYTTFRAQLEARALATSCAAEASDSGGGSSGNQSRSRVATSSTSAASRSRTRRGGDSTSEPFVLPTELLLLTEPSDLNAFLTAHTSAATRRGRRASSAETQETDSEDEDDETEEGDCSSSLGNRSTPLGFDNVTKTRAPPPPPPPPPFEMPRPSLKNLRPSPLQLQQTRVAVMSLQALVGL